MTELNPRDLARRAGIPLARQAGSSVSVYAAITGLAGAVPVPMLDAVLSELSRGAAMRRVAKRHGVTLTPDARAILATSGSIHATSTERGRLLKTALASVLAPFRVAARVDDAVGTLLSAICLDHFLRRPDRPAGAALTAAEAHRVRAATERAIGEAGFDALKTIPAGLFRILRRAFDALLAADDEGRSPIERAVDAILDGLADAPDELVDALTLQFDLALEEDRGTP
ncbi:MAG: hypothetical protein KF729_18200 [Sandaracinaceae bacterium]|nr:hypothetical protein [Sandaracinaceae bacterium]